MKTRLTILLLFVYMVGNLCAQEPAPKLLQDAASCLVAKTFLKPSTLHLGYLISTRDWPGKRVLYVVSYTSPSRASGFVFTIFITKKNQRPVFNIQNNAKFIRTKKYPDGVNFIEDPLGGIWTQEHLVSAIKRIENQPQFEISEPELQQASALEGCHAYADSFVDRK